MSVAYDHYPDLHNLIERLRPEQVGEVRAHVLRLLHSADAPNGLKPLTHVTRLQGDPAERWYYMMYHRSARSLTRLETASIYNQTNIGMHIKSRLQSRCRAAN